MAEADDGGLSNARRGKALFLQMRDQINDLELRLSEPIAIVGMACRFPGGATVDEFWETLSLGKAAPGETPPTRGDGAASYDPDPGARGKCSARGGAFTPQDPAEFDRRYFGISPREAAAI